MLILTRRPEESIIIGKDIHVKIIGVVGNQVRIGIQAPKEVAVHREAVYFRILDEQLEKEDALVGQ